LRAVLSVLSNEKKLSIAALSQTLPDLWSSDDLVGNQPLELLARILAALIGMMQQTVGLASPPDCHDERVDDESWAVRS
jgi:hypothetical protein